MVFMFEGIDGVGKSTQLRLVQKALEEAGWPVMTTRNMGGTPIGEALRDVIKSPVKRPPMTDFYISLAVQEPLLDIIDAAREEGKIVLMDRGPLSLAAYQIYGAGVDAELGWRHVAAGMDRIKPEAILLYDVAHIATALERKDGKGQDYFENKPASYFEKVAHGYRDAAVRYEQTTTIDALQSIPDVEAQTMAVIAKSLT
jgi:dTMP kinase